MPDYDDAEAAAFYADPANREAHPTSPRGPTGRLTSHVPVRFDPATIEFVQQVASEDGMTVSSWIRHVVEAELHRRLPWQSETGHDWSGEVVVENVEGVPTLPSTSGAAGG